MCSSRHAVDFEFYSSLSPLYLLCHSFIRSVFTCMGCVATSSRGTYGEPCGKLATLAPAVSLGLCLEERVAAALSLSLSLSVSAPDVA
jgi:hypothetical protein